MWVLGEDGWNYSTDELPLIGAELCGFPKAMSTPILLPLPGSSPATMAAVGGGVRRREPRILAAGMTQLSLAPPLCLSGALLTPMDFKREVPSLSLGGRS